MSSSQRCGVHGLKFDMKELERIILYLADRYYIQVRRVVQQVNPALTLGLAAVGGVAGYYFGGRTLSIVGALGGAGTGVFISLRGYWSQIRDKLIELYYMVYNYLRSLNIIDYISVAFIVYDNIYYREHLVRNIVELLACQLGTLVTSSITDN